MDFIDDANYINPIWSVTPNSYMICTCVHIESFIELRLEMFDIVITNVKSFRSNFQLIRLLVINYE